MGTSISASLLYESWIEIVWEWFESARFLIINYHYSVCFDECSGNTTVRF